MFDTFYGLTAKPFQLTPDPAFYFESATHRKALSYLGYGLAQGEGFIVITGEVGSGKSTLVAHLMATIDPARLTVGHVVTSALDGEAIVHVVAQSFGLDIEGHDKASALGAIESFLHDEARAGRRSLLVVDEAQNLAIDALEELRMLSNFQLGSHPLLQTLLLGQPEFRATLQTHPALEQLRQRVIATHHLEAMEESEIEPYLRHRLELVGWQGNPSFDPAIYPELHRVSGGIPRRLNQLANRLLLLGAVEQRGAIDLAMLGAVLAEAEIDSAVPASAAKEQPVPTIEAPSPVAERAVPVFDTPVIDPALFEGMLAERDLHIAELQQAVVELSRSVDALSRDRGAADLEAFESRITLLEGRLAEQERTIRHTLTMLIEWIENSDSQSIAA